VDVVLFPPGPEGAHIVRNDSGSTADVLILLTITAVAAVVWPDSNGSAHAWRKAGVTVDQESGDRPARQRAPRPPSGSAALTAEPARLSARRPAGEIFQTKLA
jgi:hypothetical protein